ncbi:MAG: SpoIIE family protein phosphatase [Reyranellaceae bacterium]
MRLLDETVPASLIGVSTLRRALRLRLVELRLAGSLIDDIQLAVAELGSNIVKHGRPSASRLRLLVGLQRDLLRVDLEDDGGSFDALERTLREAPKARNDARLSNMGLDFVRAGIDSLQYRPGTPNRTVLLRRLHGRRRRILLIEDDAVLRDLYGEMLARQFDLQKAASLDEARAIARQESFDLIIADLHLADGKGNEAASWSQADDGTPPAPLIILTADQRPSVRTALAREGVDAVLHKPVTARDLLAVARGSLARAARQRASALTALGALLNGRDVTRTDIARHGWDMVRGGQSAGLGSGDFILVLEGPEQTRVVLADAMGHGLKAAVSTLALTGALRALNAISNSSPPRLLSALNSAMMADDALGRLLATVLVIDLFPGGRFEVATAGHPAPLVVSRHGLRRVPASGILPGLVKDAEFSAASGVLGVGERLMLLTDGVEPGGIGLPSDLPAWLTTTAVGSLSSSLAEAGASIASQGRAQLAPEAIDDWTFVLLEASQLQPASR